MSSRSQQSHMYNNRKYILKENIKSVKVACGCYHTLLICEDGHLYTFGRGNHGQLGHGNIDDQAMPRQVPNLTDIPIKVSKGTQKGQEPKSMHLKVIEIAGGFYHSVILLRQRNSEIPNVASDHCLINRQYYHSYKENQNENLKHTDKEDIADLKVKVEEF